MKLLENPKITKKLIPDEKDFFEIEWEFESYPDEIWVTKLFHFIKSYLEKTDELFGPYRPRVFGNFFITTLFNEDLIEKQKNFFEEIFSKISS